jgi:sulfate/thiosulfate transport system substrate-binding protein
MLTGTNRRLIAPAVALALVALLGAACSSSKSTTSTGGTTGGTAGAGGTINLVAYSTPQAAYTQLEAAFQKTPAGQGVHFKQSYGASGDQSRAVAAGQPADFVNFSLEPDVTRLVKAGLVASSWNANQYKGFITNSVVVFIVRKGNPKHIQSWDDLTKSGVSVITPNPFSSGSARWNIMAAYGAQLKAGKTPAEAEQYLADLFKNVSVQDSSARNALQTFTGGKGDVLLDYENDAIFAQQNGEDVDYVIPAQTILIQNPAAVTVKSTNPTAAKAFLSYLYSPAGQKIWAANGYRPVVPGVVPASKFKTPAQQFTIDDLGGWTSVTAKFFDPTSGVVTKIEQSNGVSTSSK